MFKYAPVSYIVGNKKLLKSDLKKGTMFSKKIKTITPDGLQQCVKDVDTLNLTPYISEIQNAIVEVNYKITDVPTIVNLCVGLHRLGSSHVIFATSFNTINQY